MVGEKASRYRIVEKTGPARTGEVCLPKDHCAETLSGKSSVRKRNPLFASSKSAWVGIACLLLIVSLARMFAQTTSGRVTGIVEDETGGVLPGAAVTLTNVETGVKRTSLTNDTGAFTLVSIEPGEYALEIEVPGFKVARTSPFTLTVNQSLTQDVTLSIGDITETIEVLFSAPLLQAASTELGTVIEKEAVVNLPLNGRNFSQLLTLTPGATPVSTAQGSSGGPPFNAPVSVPGASFKVPSIQGQFNRANLYLLDGTNNSYFFRGSWAVVPIIDAVQEFKLQSHNDKAQFGGVLGGVVNVVTRSGTNEFDGSAWAFVRNDVLDARDPFADEFNSKPAPFRQSQFGGMVSGPIFKNRTFFTFAYEGWRYRKPEQSRARVPTPEELSGNFSYWLSVKPQPILIFDPLTTREDLDNPGRLIRDPFPENIIPSDRISPMTQGYIDTYYDEPNLTGDPFYNVIWTGSLQNDSDSWTVKVDHAFGEKNNIFFRYASQEIREFNPWTNKAKASRPMTPKTAGGGWSHTFSSSMILDVRLGWSSQPFTQLQEAAAGEDPMSQLGFTGLDEFGIVVFGLSEPWDLSFAPVTDAANQDSQIHIDSSLTWLSGSHNFKFGGQLFYKTAQSRSRRQSFSFTDSPTSDPSSVQTGISLASALLGLPTEHGFENRQYRIEWPVWALYFQDEWRIHRTVTLTYGLRFDHLDTPHMAQGMNNGFDFDTGTWLIGGDVMPPACDAVGQAPCIPGDGSLANIPYGDHIKLAKDTSIANRDLGPLPEWDNWGPRIGVAWRWNDRTVLRSGYSLIWDVHTATAQTAQQSIGTWPDQQAVVSNWNPIGGDLEFIDQIVKTGREALPATDPWGSSGWFFDPDGKKNPYSHQWHVEVQHQITDSVMGSVGYVGSFSDRLELAGLVNVAPPGPSASPDVIAQRRTWPWVAPKLYSTDRGEANYHSLQAKLNQRFTGGLGYLISYTWGKSIDNGSSGFFAAENGPGGSSALQDFNDPEGSRSVSSFDVPHFLSASIMWEPPLGRGHEYFNQGPASWTLGNWQVNMILQARTGQPYNLSVMGDVANTGGIPWWHYARPNLVGDPNVSKPTPARWYNPDAFSVPVASVGSLGRNVLRTENVYHVDVSLFKRFRLWREQTWLEFRAEFFNLFNIMNYGAPDTTIGSSNAGRIITLATGSMPRQIQFGLRFVF